MSHTGSQPAPGHQWDILREGEHTAVCGGRGALCGHRTLLVWWPGRYHGSKVHGGHGCIMVATCLLAMAVSQWPQRHPSGRVLMAMDMAWVRHGRAHAAPHHSQTMSR